MSNILFEVAIVFFTGLLFAKIVKKFKMPSVTGYLIGGLLIGPYFLNLVSIESVEGLKIFSEIALGFIAFSIGSEFKISYFKKVGITPIVIAFAEAFGAVILVTLALVLFGFDLPFSIMLGAIASATAPAATIMVIKQYKAKGPVTETLLSVVAIDDAAALIAFGFALAFTKSISAAESVNLFTQILQPFVEIFMSIIIGGLLGLFLSYVIRFFKDNANRLCLIIAMILTCISAAVVFHASSLLVCMVFGAVYCNLSDTSESLLFHVDDFTPPLFMMFFVLSGAELDLRIIPTIGLVGIIYVVFRVIGKMIGAYAGAKVMKADKKICKYLGPCLIPQAGVAIGLSLIAESALPQDGSTIRAVILCGTLIYELVGPFVTKMSLKAAHEIDQNM